VAAGGLRRPLGERRPAAEAACVPGNVSVKPGSPDGCERGGRRRFRVPARDGGKRGTSRVGGLCVDVPL